MAPLGGASFKKGKDTDRASPAEVEEDSTVSERLNRSTAELTELVQQASEKLLEADGVEVGVRDAIRDNVQSAFAWLSREVAEVLSRLSEADNNAMRTRLKEQRATFEARMDDVRTAGNVQLQNQAAELEAVTEKKIADRVTAVTNGGDAAIREVEQKLQAANAELAEVKLKVSGVESALGMAQQRLKSSEARVVTLEKEAAEASERITSLTAELQVCTEQTDAQIVALKISGVKTIKHLSDKLKVVFEATMEHTAVAHALSSYLPPLLQEFEVGVDEGATLDERVAALVTHLIGAAQLARQERDELSRERDALEQERDALTSKVQGLEQAAHDAEQKRLELASRLAETQDAYEKTKAELASCQAELTEARKEIERLAKAAALIDKLEATIAQLERDLAATVEALKREKEEARLREEGLLERLETLSYELKHEKTATAGLQKALTLSEDKCAETQEELKSTKAAMDELLARLNDSDPDAQMKYWKAEAERFSAKLALVEKEMARSRETLEKTMRELNLKVDENKTLEQHVSEMMQHLNEIQAAKVKLEEQSKLLSRKISDTMSSLKISTDRNKKLTAENMTLEEQLAELIREYRASKAEVDKFTQMLQKTKASLRIKVDENKTLEEQLSGVLREFESNKLEMARCRAQLKQLIEALQVKTEEGMTLGEQLGAIAQEQERQVQALVSVLHPEEAKQAMVKGTKVKTEDTLSELISKMVDRYYAGQYAMEQSERQAGETAEALGALRARLEYTEETSKEQLKEVNEARERERKQLVKAATEALQQLRMSLTKALQSSAASNTAELKPENFGYNRLKNRWGVLSSNGTYDHIVVQVEGTVPPKGSTTSPGGGGGGGGGGGAGAASSASPRLPQQPQRQRRRQPVHPPRRSAAHLTGPEQGVQARVPQVLAEPGFGGEEHDRATPPRMPRRANLPPAPSPEDALLSAQTTRDPSPNLPMLPRLAHPVVEEERPGFPASRSHSTPAAPRPKAKASSLHGGALSKALANPVTPWAAHDEGEELDFFSMRPFPAPPLPPKPLDPVPLGPPMASPSNGSFSAR